jgi:hypothetical protein
LGGCCATPPPPFFVSADSKDVKVSCFEALV